MEDNCKIEQEQNRESIKSRQNNGEIIFPPYLHAQGNAEDILILNAS